MVSKCFVKSFYNGLQVTCYERRGWKYVANQHGNWDVYEGEYARGEKARTLQRSDKEIAEVVSQYYKQPQGSDIQGRPDEAVR